MTRRLVRLALWNPFALMFGAMIVATPAMAQLPFNPPGQAETLARLPNDQIEGTIWEYRGKPKFKPAAGEKTPKLEGRFRIEDEAVFAVTRRVKLPSVEDVKEKIEEIRTGDGVELELPGGPQTTRIGEYTRLSKSRIRLELDDKKALHGIMVLQLKKNTDDVWIGEYTEMEGKKKLRKWQVEVRSIED